LNRGVDSSAGYKMKVVKVKMVVIVNLFLFLVLFLSGCSTSLTSSIIISDTELESGEITNMYLTISRTKGLFESGPFNVIVAFSSGEGVEVIDESYNIIKIDNLTISDGSISKTYKVRAKVIVARQIVDNIIINLNDNKGKTSVVISPDIIVYRRRV